MIALPKVYNVIGAARTQKGTLGAAVLIAFSWVFYLSAWPHVLPARYWFSVERVEVMDGVAGKAPAMVVERTIRRPFQGAWIATVMRQDAGGFFTYCTAHGANDYLPENKLRQLHLNRLNLDHPPLQGL